MARFNGNVKPVARKGRGKSKSKSTEGSDEKSKTSLYQGGPLPIEPRCSICKCEYRRQIDKLLVTHGISQAEIIRHYEQAGIKFSARAMSNHSRKHLSARDAVVRRAAERSYQRLVGEVDETETHIITSDAVLDTMLIKGYEKLALGDIDPTYSDMLSLVDRLEKMRYEKRQAEMDLMIAKLNILIAGIKEFAPKDTYAMILQHYKVGVEKLMHERARQNLQLPAPKKGLIDG